MFEPYILNRSRWKKKLVHWLFENENFKSVRLWRALTETEADQIRSYGLTQPIVTIPNGINLKEFDAPAQTSGVIDTPLAGDLPKTRPRVLFIARIHPKKGLDLLIPAWARIHSLIKDWQLIVAGPDEGRYMAKMQRLTHSLDLANDVIFTGPSLARRRQAFFARQTSSFCLLIRKASP